MTREEYEEIRHESDTDYALRKMVANMNGGRCFNCGSRECIEYHHIVPLKVGGTNTITNYVALCHRCHCAAHYGRHIRDYANKKVSGRPHKAANEVMTAAFDELIAGKIGRTECRVKINLSGNTKVSDLRVFEEYLKEKGIKLLKNNIDIILSRRGYIAPGDIIGYVEYESGVVENLYWEGEYREGEKKKKKKRRSA